MITSLRLIVVLAQLLSQVEMFPQDSGWCSELGARIASRREDHSLRLPGRHHRPHCLRQPLGHGGSLQGPAAEVRPSCDPRVTPPFSKLDADAPAEPGLCRVRL